MRDIDQSHVQLGELASCPANAACGPRPSCAREDVIGPPLVEDVLKPSVKRRNCKLYYHMMCGLGPCFSRLSHSAASPLQQSSKSTE